MLFHRNTVEYHLICMSEEVTENLSIKSTRIFVVTSLIILPFSSSIIQLEKNLKMNAALALIFFACVAGSMASDARGQIVDQLVQQGQVIAQSVMSLLQQQLFAIAQQAIGHVQSLVASIGRFDFDFNGLLNSIKPLISGQINQVLAQLLGSLQGLIGGM